MKITSKSTAEFRSDIYQIWHLLADNTDYEFRSDVQEIIGL